MQRLKLLFIEIKNWAKKSRPGERQGIKAFKEENARKFSGKKEKLEVGSLVKDLEEDIGLQYQIENKGQNKGNKKLVFMIERKGFLNLKNLRNVLN